MPTGIAVDSSGTIWVADTLNNRIQSFVPSSNTWTVFLGPTGKGQTNFKVPWGVTVAPDASIWVSDTGNFGTVSMSTAGVINLIATQGSMGIPSVSNGSSGIYPFAIAFSGDTVYLSDIWNNRVVVLTTS